MKNSAEQIEKPVAKKLSVKHEVKYMKKEASNQGHNS